MSFFENIENINDIEYIVLFNNSYLTSLTINVNLDDVECNIDINKNISKNNKKKSTILEYQKKIMKKHLNDIGCKKFYFMLWNNDIEIKNKEPITLNDFDDMNISYDMCGDNNLSNALKKIPYNWHTLDKDINIIVITTCDIWDDFVPYLKRITKTNINISFLTVECSNIDYDKNIDKNAYSTTLYNKITNKYVDEFYCWTEKYVSHPFIIYKSNEKKNTNLIPFGEKFFKVKNIYKFIGFIKKLINETENDDEIYEISKKLINTISHLTQNESYETKLQRIQIFVNLFSNIKNKEIINIVKNNMLIELNKPKINNETGYIEFKKINEEYYDKIYSSIELCEFKKIADNKTISNNNDWLSLPISNNKNNELILIKTKDKNVNKDIILFDKKFMGCGLKLSNNIIPMFPINLFTKRDNSYCAGMSYIIYMIKIYYSKKYNIGVNNYYIQYYIFCDIYNILISDILDDVKEIYRNLCFEILNIKRYGSEQTELEYLYDNLPGNKFKTEKQRYYSFKKIIKLSGIDENLNPYIWWYYFIKLLKDPILEKIQYRLCSDFIQESELDISTFEKNAKKYSIKLNYIEYNDDVIDYDYNCYYSLENIEKEGGYIFTSHKIDDDIQCNPKLMLSKECYDVIKEENNNIINCPICCRKLKMDKLTFIEDKEKYYNDNNKKKKEHKIQNLECDINRYEKINLEKLNYGTNDNIKKMDECVLKACNYEINHPQLVNTYYSKFVEIYEQKKFNRSVFNKYAFLKNLNWEGVCLSGGFCRTIILKQKIKDFDFFFYGNDCEKNFLRFLNEILTNIKNKVNNVKFLFLYKQQYNVFEVICINDDNNFFHEDFNLDNFENYDYNSLYRYNKFIVINPETNKVMRKVNNEYWDVINKLDDKFSSNNYFEDFDVNSIKIKYRLQFILCKFDSIVKIFENFDMEPCKVAWDGNTTWFTEKSELAYRYMMNVIDEKIFYSDEYRIGKYFSYGFKIILPKLDVNKLKMQNINNDKKIKLSKLEFDIKGISDNKIIIKHNSHVKKQLENIEKLEKMNIEKGKYLYKSFWFCSLISILRYVKIQQISYKFSDKIILPTDNGFFSFTENDNYVQFKDNIKNKTINIDIYGDLKIKN